jgi:hypothetical protein
MITTTLLITAADDQSPVVSALYFYRDSRSLDLASRFPPKCSDGTGGTSFCGLFEPKAEGRYTIDAYAMDAAGNLGWAGSQYRYLFVDATGPTVTLNPRAATPFRATAIADAPALWTIPFSGTVADPLLADGYPSSGVKGVRVRLIDANGNDVGLAAEQVATVSGGAWSIDYVVSADNPSGVYSGTLIAEDTAGNKTMRVIPPFTVDNTDPSSQVTVFNAPPAALTAARGPSAGASAQVAQYLNASSSLAGSVNERPDSAPTLSNVAGVSAAEVAFEPILGSAYIHRPLPDGVQLYLPLDENNVAQGVADTSFLDIVRGYTVTCAANACPVSAIAAHSGQGVYFNGVNARLSRTATPSVTNLTSDMGVGAWIKLDRVQGAQYIISTDRAASANNGWAFGAFDDKLRFEKFGSSTYETYQAVLKPNVWYHVAAYVKLNHDVDFFVNGLQVSAFNTPQAGIANTDDGLVIGGAATVGAQPLAGVIDEVFVARGYLAGFLGQLMGDGPNLHVTFDKAPMGSADAFKEVGGMDVLANTYIGGSADRSTVGIVGAYGVEFSADKAYAIGALAGPGVLPTGYAPWTMSFWLRDAGSAVVYLTYSQADTQTAYAAVFSGQDRTVTQFIGNEVFVTPLGPTEGWNHYAFAFEDTAMKVYQNGVARQTITPTGPVLIGPTTWLVVYDAEHPNPTAIDDLMSFSRALTAEELAGMARTAWQPASINASGAGISTTAWSAGIPPKLEGFYAVKTRGRDVAGNVNEEPRAAWSGMVDTLPPRMSVVSQTSGEFTQYFVYATDFSIDIGGMTFPAGCVNGGFYPDYNYRSPWYLALQNQAAGLSGPRLYEMQGVCLTEVAHPLPANATFKSCDRLGNCATVDLNGNPVPLTARSWLPRIAR